jgi:hypothetical protein
MVARIPDSSAASRRLSSTSLDVAVQWKQMKAKFETGVKFKTSFSLDGFTG